MNSRLRNFLQGGTKQPIFVHAQRKNRCASVHGKLSYKIHQYYISGSQWYTPRVVLACLLFACDVCTMLLHLHEGFFARSAHVCLFFLCPCKSLHCSFNCALNQIAQTSCLMKFFKEIYFYIKGSWRLCTIICMRSQRTHSADMFMACSVAAFIPKKKTSLMHCT